VSRAVIDLRVGLAEGRADDVTRTLREISKVVIEPIAASIDRADALVVLPDEELYAVPFAALSIGRGDEALARRHAITIAPGFSVFGRARAAAPSTFGGRVLVVAPAVRQAITLPAAVQEARDVASSYPRVTSLAGADATPERFLAGVAEHAIVHFAGHGVANEDQPAFSRLLLAAAPRAAGGLLASDIARQRFPNTRLVVLGACESARGAIRSGEGVLSIARAFLVAGVPTVVGALWEVDDEMTRRLLKQFHNDIARGETPAAALRRAQLAMLSDANPMVRHPMSWAGFVVMEAGRRTPVK